MRIYGPTSPRSFPTDRNPTRIALSVGGMTANPGGTTLTLATYTVPAARKAQLYTLDGFQFVTTALAAGQASDIEVLINGTSFTARRLPPASALAALISLTLNGLFLTAGDVLLFRCVTGAGAGAVSVTGGFDLVEYDA